MASPRPSAIAGKCNKTIHPQAIPRAALKPKPQVMEQPYLRPRCCFRQWPWRWPVRRPGHCRSPGPGQQPGHWQRRPEAGGGRLQARLQEWVVNPTWNDQWIQCNMERSISLQCTRQTLGFRVTTWQPAALAGSPLTRHPSSSIDSRHPQL